MHRQRDNFTIPSCIRINLLEQAYVSRVCYVTLPATLSVANIKYFKNPQLKDLVRTNILTRISQYILSHEHATSEFVS